MSETDMLFLAMVPKQGGHGFPCYCPDKRYVKEEAGRQSPETIKLA